MISDRAVPQGASRVTTSFPPPLAGASTLALGFADAILVETVGLDLDQTMTPNRVRSVPSGPVYLRPQLAPGSTVVRVDVFGFADAAATQDWSYGVFDIGDDTTTAVTPVTLSGTGVLNGEIVPANPAPLNASQWALIGCVTNASTWLRGAVVHYTPPAAPAVPATPAIVPIVPKRVYDSRTTGKLAPDEERTISVATALNGSGQVVPTGATAVAITITVTDTEDAGYVSAFPAGTQWQGTSTVNWFGPGQNLATAAILSLGGDRQLTLRGGVARTNVVVDVTAYVA